MISNASAWVGSAVITSLVCLSSCGSDQQTITREASTTIPIPSEPEDGPMSSPLPGEQLEHELAGIEQVRFSDSDVTPSPACLAVAPGGEVFVGVDEMGSLGKDSGRGRIMRLVDMDGDGKADQHTLFAKVNNPRGLLPSGDCLFVLHTTFSEATGKADGMQLVVFEDKDQDGLADGPSKPLLEHISNAKFVADRGTDHATNGIRMGIDGWIYIAVGDFGFYEALDRAGKRLTQLGGGVLRIRPDGTETEVYTHGLRNIYDVAIDPYMNLFTRGNTNDGGGWNVRFIHHLQSAEYGYPMLFKHFTEEIAPALADVGGGSGTGSLFLHDAHWPESLNHLPLMADWGRSQLFSHRVQADGASFQQEEEEFLQVAQITDLDVDGSGRLYLAAWDGAGYFGSPDKGHVVRATPADWKLSAYVPSSELDLGGLEQRLRSGSAAARLDASQELLRRGTRDCAEKSLAVTWDRQAPLYVRVAGLFTYAQIQGAQATDELVKLTGEGPLREFALRALTDRVAHKDQVPLEPLMRGLLDPSARVRAAATVALGRLGKNFSGDAAKALLAVAVPESFRSPVPETEGPHATPNAAILLPHLAVRALNAQGATQAAITALQDANLREATTPPLALWAMRTMHDPSVVEALIQSLEKAPANAAMHQAQLETLARIYHAEAAYDGSWWWNTRPDTHGPYYKGEVWSASPAIERYLLNEWRTADEAGREVLVELNRKYRLGLAPLAPKPESETADEPLLDLAALADKSGEVGDAAIEDVLIALTKLTPDTERGLALFASQGCAVCHTLNSKEKPKGPFMGQIGSIMAQAQIAESILRPDASISQGFASVLITLKTGQSMTGFVTEESATKLVLRDIAGKVTELALGDIAKREEFRASMMPTGLVSGLSLQDFASLVGFLAQQK